MYNMFHRQYMHAMLMESAMKGGAKGTPVRLVVNHKCKDINTETGWITFMNGTTATRCIVIGADGIGSVVMSVIGINSEDTTVSTRSSYLLATVASASPTTAFSHFQRRLRLSQLG